MDAAQTTESESQELAEALRMLEDRRRWGVLRVAARCKVDPVRLEAAAIALRIRQRRVVSKVQRLDALRESESRRRAEHEAKHERIRTLIRSDPELSDAAISERTGVSRQVVNSLRRTERQSDHSRSQP